jgi:mono/diheme cytochrome c family protein
MIRSLPLAVLIRLPRIIFMKVVSIVTVIGALVVLGLLAQNEKQSFDRAAYYKANCEECHGASAEKKFNPNSPEGQMIDSILNGAKAEGSRDMPAFAEKGVDEAKAKELISYMKSIRE